MTNPLLKLGQLGQSLWYDYITRDLVASGELSQLIVKDGLRGMTSNPTIFEKAIAGSRLYDDDIRRLSDQGCTAGQIFEALSVAEVHTELQAMQPPVPVPTGAQAQRTALVNAEVQRQLLASVPADPEGEPDA